MEAPRGGSSRLAGGDAVCTNPALEQVAGGARSRICNVPLLLVALASSRTQELLRQYRLIFEYTTNKYDITDSYMPGAEK
jgi:hypothetical protein